MLRIAKSQITPNILQNYKNSAPMSIVLTYFLRIMGVMGSSVNYGSDGKIERIGLIGQLD